MFEKSLNSSSDPEDGSGEPPSGEEGAAPSGQDHISDHRKVDMHIAFRIAGAVVATFHSRYHHLTGDIVLDPVEGKGPLLNGHITNGALNSDVQPLTGTALQVNMERNTLLMAGRQAELIHYTLNSTMDSDRLINELSAREPEFDGIQLHEGQHHISAALDLVTHHWREIELLALWLTRQHRKTIPIEELIRQVEGIAPEDQGKFT